MMSTLFANVAVVGQHCHRRAPRSRRRQRWLAALLLLLLFPQTPSWADEVVRQVQEELRRRNLYYGDIDGRNSRAVASALRRYQERKGFPVSGAPDDETLHSLGIAPPAATVVQTSGSGGGGDNQAASRETSANSEVWPQGTVLKSDSARRHHGAFADGVRGLTPLSTAEAAEVAMPSPELLMMPPASASVLVAPSPASSGSNAAAGPMTVAQAREFIWNYLRACETNQLDEEMKFYADPVDYFDQGMLRLAFIRRDVKYYYNRWPERKYELLDSFRVAPGPQEGESTIWFMVRFRYHRPPSRGDQGEVNVAGRTENTFVVRRGSELEGPQIISMREHRVR